MCRQGAQGYENFVKKGKLIDMSKTWVYADEKIAPTRNKNTQERWCQLTSINPVFIKYCPECGEVYDDPSSSAFRKGLCHICNTELKEEEVK